MILQLEPRLGTARFATVIGSLVVGSSAVYCALQYVAAQLLGPSHLHTCAAGFSCVLFGLKVIMQSTSPPSHSLFGFPIHMAYWSELIWISIISPNASFVGHLAGFYLIYVFQCSIANPDSRALVLFQKLQTLLLAV